MAVYHHAVVTAEPALFEACSWVQMCSDVYQGKRTRFLDVQHVHALLLASSLDFNPQLRTALNGWIGTCVENNLNLLLVQPLST